jgi:transcription elongation factor Elf1
MPCDFCGALAVSDFEVTHLGQTARLLICGNCLGYGENSIYDAKSVWDVLEMVANKVSDRIRCEGDKS